jgi:hypothetical protein
MHILLLVSATAGLPQHKTTRKLLSRQACSITVLLTALMPTHLHLAHGYFVVGEAQTTTKQRKPAAASCTLPMLPQLQAALQLLSSC